MAGVQRVGTLEVAQDLEFQRRSWTVQRIGWVVMALVIVAALLGLFGPGPLSSATAGEQGGALWAEYRRFGRYASPSTLRIHLGTGAARDGEARVWLSREYLEGVRIQHITPEPDSVEAGLDRITYAFRVAEPGQPVAVTFHLELQQIGPTTGRVGLPDGPSLTFSQFVYP
jgi:hypothetical protein